MVTASTEPLSISSQFHFCSLPLRLDSYRGCGFGCAYCFALQRGGNVAEQNIAPADKTAVEKLLKRSASGDDLRSPVVEMLRQRVPIHFGGMSDPFQPAERKFGITKEYLRALSETSYPVVISTKGALVGAPVYRDLFRAIKHVVIQFSFSSVDNATAARTEPNSDPPSRLLSTMESLAADGFNVTCRWQPYIRGVSENANEFVPTVVRAGAQHLALEHLKVPVERGVALRGSVPNAVLLEQRESYKELEARRDGREFVLSANRKIALVLEVRAKCHELGITFGAADNELQYLSDTEACCSGVDRFPGFENVFRFNIGCAIRRCVGSEIRYESIADEWRPSGSIDRYLNSKSRLGRRLGVRGTVEDHVRYRWNSRHATGNPESFFRVRRTSALSSSGDALFQWEAEADSPSIVK